MIGKRQELFQFNDAVNILVTDSESSRFLPSPIIVWHNPGCLCRIKGVLLRDIR